MAIKTEDNQKNPQQEELEETAQESSFAPRMTQKLSLIHI